MSNAALPSAQVRFCHPLLHARDWQHRPQLDEVCRWWSEGGSGVCALVGIGGAGKTAIADRFLQVLPGAMPPRPDLPKRPDLRPPARLLVFSFYDAPNPDSFFTDLFSFLADTSGCEEAPRPVTRSVSEGGHRPVSYQQTLLALHSFGAILLVLDGLEKVQDDGGRGGIFGELQDGRLSDLLVRVAEGTLPRVSVLITSRFPLAELDERCSLYYRPLAVEEIDEPTAIALLTQRGVRGTNDQLRRIADDCGRHALTVDLAGGYIAEFGCGVPATPLQLTRFDDAEHARRAEPTNARRRGVRLQEYNFARIAERYRAAFKASDPAALALLERICLFRLGVTADMLALIFTGAGEDKQRIAGPALAGLTREQLDRTLDRLIAMKLVEKGDVRSVKCEGNSEFILPTSNFSIHPAVRDGFLAGLDADTRRHGHEAARTGLTTALGDSSGRNPSDPATLDLLEEIVHHALQSGHVSEAWTIYWNQIGGYNNLGRRLGAYERGIRISRALAEQGLCTPTDDAASLPTHVVHFLTFAWGLYLSAVGRLDNAATRLRLAAEGAEASHDWYNAALGCHNFGRTALLAGKLRQAIEWSKKGQALLSRAKGRSSPGEWVYHFGYLAQMLALRGDTVEALSTFQNAEKCIRALGQPEMPLAGQEGLFLAQLLARFGRSTEAQEHVKANITASGQMWGQGHHQIPKYNLLRADLHREAGDVTHAEDLWGATRDWAVEHDAKEVLCWSAVVQAKIERSAVSDRHSANMFELRPQAHNSLADGLRIARDCGFGIYHIDLLLESARLHLLCREPQAVLDDLRTALDDGVSANAHTGRPELLAATHAECGYAWGIAEGLSLRGEALLLQAAQTLGQDSFFPAERSALPAPVRDLLTQAESCLNQALDRWHQLRDPARKNANFRHPKTRKQYNSRAVGTYRILTDLSGGVLTRYPLAALKPAETAASNAQTKTKEVAMTKRFAVALSFPGEHRAYVEQIADALAAAITKPRVFYDRYYEAELSRPNLDTYLQKIYHDDSELVVVVLCKQYDEKEWCGLEFRAIRDLIKKRRDDEIMFVRVADGDVKGVFGIDGYVDAKNRPAAEIAQVIRDRLALLRSANP